MGTRGPIPKREDSRRRRNKPATETIKANAKPAPRSPAGEPAAKAVPDAPAQSKLSARHFNPDGSVKAPPASKDWHPMATRIWHAAVVSGQARFYEPSDWAVFYSLMDDLSHYKRATKRPAVLLQTIMSSLTSLLLTEGDRRRLQIELKRPDKDDEAAEDVTVMDEWRQKLS